jgi:transcriptional regulator with XRE-family HTH domain
MARIPPMKYIGRAIRALRKQNRWTLEFVANQIDGYDATNLSRVERGEQGIDPQKLQKIAVILGVKLSDLYNQAEQLERVEADEIRTSAGVPRKSSDRSAQGQATNTLPEDQRGPRVAPSPDAWEFVLIPHIAVARAAGGQVTIEVDQADAPYPIPTYLFNTLGFPIERARTIRIRNEAMANTITAGDSVIVDRGDVSIESGRVFALLMRDELMIRRLIRTPTGTIVRCDNKHEDFPSFELTQEQWDATVQIVGRVKLKMGSGGL